MHRAFGHFFPKVCQFFPKKLNIFPNSRKNSKFFRKYNFSPLRFNFFPDFFERGQTTGLLLVKSGFGARTIFLRGTCAEVSRRHCASEVPSPAAGKHPLRNSNFSFSEEPFPERFKNFPKLLFPSCRTASKFFRKSSKFYRNYDFPYLQITADAVLATPASCPGTIQGYSLWMGPIAFYILL